MCISVPLFDMNKIDGKKMGRKKRIKLLLNGNVLDEVSKGRKVAGRRK